MKSLLTLKSLVLSLTLFLVFSVLSMHAQKNMRTGVVNTGSHVECYSNMKTKMVSSAFPVSVQLKGSRLCITSKYSQALPVYNDKGAFYGVFRLNKGTNWISGLPKGTYFVNNRKVVVP